MEVELLSSFLKSREVFERVVPHLDKKQYGEMFNRTVKVVSEYYNRDTDAKSANHELVRELLFQGLANDKHKDAFATLLGRAVAYDASAGNVEALVLGAKRAEAGRKMIAAISNLEDASIINPLIEEYISLRDSTSYKPLGDTQGFRVYRGLGDGEDDASRASQWRLKLLPVSLHKALDEEGLGPGDHVVIFGPPEIGKSALANTIACAFARQRARGAWFENEENYARTKDRSIANLSGMDKWAIRDNRKLAVQKALDKGGDCIIGVDLTGYGFERIEQVIQAENDGGEEPLKWIVVNQIHNVQTKSDNEVLRRERCAQAVRDIAKKYGIVGISVTQGGDSCVDKAYLDMNDLFMNKTGIQGTADLMIGISGTKAMIENDERGISFPKDKISFNHKNVPVRFNGALSRVEDI